MWDLINVGKIWEGNNQLINHPHFLYFFTIMDSTHQSDQSTWLAYDAYPPVIKHGLLENTLFFWVMFLLKPHF
jgi:hypothetical protein